MLKYGLQFPDNLLDFQIELHCFKVAHPSSAGGLGKYRHFKNVCKIFWPDLIWHDWLTEQIRSLCGAYHGGPKPFMTVAWTGCATSGKTFALGLFMFVWWLADPPNSIGILTSTTKDMIRRRVWPVIQQLYHSARQNMAERLKVDVSKIHCGNLVDSRTALQASKGDDKHSIFAIAVRDGETSKAVANIQGQHAPRIMIVIDEATNTPEAIFETIPNLRKGCQELLVALAGNAASRMDGHGRACEPELGFHSITKSDTNWKTKGVPEWQLDPGVCLHFAGSQSPNVKAGRTIYPFIYGWEDYQNALKLRGAENLLFWSFDEGFWPPDGFCNTIFTETMVDKYDLKGKHVFLSKAMPIAGLDPGFGGDEGILTIGLLGDLENGQPAVQLTAMIPIRLKATSADEYETQIAVQVRAECEKRGVKDDCFGMDATAIGRGAFAVLKENWGAGIVRVEFGGAPTERPASGDDPRPSREVYDRYVTELWYSAREFAVGGQLKGLDRETIVEFCSRQYSLKNRKYSLETKDDFKDRFKKSPNRADAVVVLLEVARQKGAVARGHSVTPVGAPKETVALIEKINDVYAHVDYSVGYEEPEYDPS